MKMGFKQVQWAAIKKNEDCSSSSSSSSSINDSLSSSDLGDDASSSSSSSSTTCDNNISSSNGPLYELADLMAQLPIKRGLSKFYNGKSQTFGSLSNVKSVEDLGKMSCSRRIKSCKRNLNNTIYHKFSPKATIAKRSTITSCLSTFGTKSSFFIHG